MVLGREQRMVLEVVHEVLLAVLPQEIELDLARDWSPFEVVEGLRGFYLGPARPRVHNSLHHFAIVASEHNVLVQLAHLLLIQRE